MLPNIHTDTGPDVFLDLDLDTYDKRNNFDTDSLYWCSKCCLEFDTTNRRPFVTVCGHSICMNCSYLLDIDSCHVCDRHTTYSLNVTLYNIIAAREITRCQANCLNDEHVHNIPIQNKLICKNTACRCSQKIMCIPCYGFFHYMCTGKSVGNNARYYLSSFRNCYNETQISFEIDTDFRCKLDKWKKICTYENLLKLAIDFYTKCEYVPLDSSLITGDFLKTHFLKNKINYENKNVWKFMYDAKLNHRVSTVDIDDKENTYIFTNSSIESNLREDSDIFVNMFAEELSRIENKHFIVNSNGVLKYMNGCVEKPFNCIPLTILDYLRVCVFELLKDIERNTITSYDFIRDHPSGIKKILTSNINGMEYWFTTYCFKNSEEMERVKNDYCYFVESHYQQIVICVRLDKKKRMYTTKGMIKHSHTSKKRHLIRKTNK